MTIDLKALRASIIATALKRVAEKSQPKAKPEAKPREARPAHCADAVLKPIARAALTRVQTCPLCGRTDDLTIETGLWFTAGRYGRTFRPHGSMDEFLALPLQVERLDPIDRECPSCLRAESTIEASIFQTQWRQQCLFH